MSSGIIDHINKILSEFPEGSPGHKATLVLMEKFEEFFIQLQDAEAEEVERLLAEFINGDQPLLQSLGKLVRKFHTQKQIVSSDVSMRLGEIAEHDMVSASERLENIVSMTQNAAETTMGLAENMMEVITERQGAIAASLEKIEAGLAEEGTPAKVQEALREAEAALKSQAAEQEKHQETLTDILMAQGYQDLTGQVVQKIVNLLANLEKELLDLVKAFGTVQTKKEKTTSKGVLEGPLSQESKGRVSQDQADDLLKSFGF